MPGLGGSMCIRRQPGIAAGLCGLKTPWQRTFCRAAAFLHCDLPVGLIQVLYMMRYAFVVRPLAVFRVHECGGGGAVELTGRSNSSHRVAAPERAFCGALL